MASASPLGTNSEKSFFRTSLKLLSQPMMTLIAKAMNTENKKYFLKKIIRRNLALAYKALIDF
jgi:hypothetical protein